MNNYSKQESEKAMSEVRDFNYIGINNLEVKIRPKNFESIKDNPVSASYVNAIMERFINDFNEIFVPELNNKFHPFIEELREIQDKITELGTINHNNIDGWE